MKVPLVIFALTVCMVAGCRSSQASSTAALEEYAAGTSAYLRGDLREAADLYARAAALDPELSEATYMLCKISALEGRTAEAAAGLDELLGRSPAHLDAAILLCRLHLQQDRPGQTRELAVRMLAGNGNDPRLLHLLGKAYAAEGDPELAIAYLTRATFFRENLGQIYVDLARVHYRHGMNDEAEAELELSLELLDPEGALAHSVSSLLARLKDQGR